MSDQQARERAEGGGAVRVLVCGSRDFSHPRLASRIARIPDGSTVIHGGARGIDTLAGIIAESLGFEVEEWRADWKRDGKRAGILRNIDMLDTKPDLVLAFWDGRSRGTAHMIKEARKRGIPVEVSAVETT